MTVILVSIAIYMLSMLFIGYLAKRHVKSSADFFIGGGRFGSALTAIAHQAAGLSGWLFIAWSQQVAGSGLGAIWTAFSSGFAPFINFFVMAKRVAKFTVMTKARSFIDLLEARYYDEDRKIIRALATVIIAISITVYMSSQLMAAGTTFQAVLGLDYRVSVLIGAVVVILYTSAGGLLAVAWTDFVQGMVQFFRYHHQEYENGPETTLVFGGDAKIEDCTGGRVVLVGNCTAKLRGEGRAFCKGCPPVPSQIARTIDAGVTLDD